MARRVLAGPRRGSSRPVIVETGAGPRLVKLRGAAQGTGPLVAEVIVAGLAEALGLEVPERCLVELPEDVPRDDHDDELADLLAASAGENLGFVLLDDAIDVRGPGLDEVGADDQARILWLDRFVLNPDRTRRNPNLLSWRGRTWLIDQGAALGFQYAWPAIAPDAARAAGRIAEPHVFEAAAATASWPELDAALAAILTPGVIAGAVAAVPESFLAPRAPWRGAAHAVSVAPPRAAYIEFLVRRLAPPRAFATDGPTLVPATTRAVRPEWLRRP